ncbi:ankyrin repeat-containing domain protein [Paraphoma chrysanthemicola]|nr:ankyrin repeat-containing domain protein [Paraphoma chrysanthemicola]
MSVSDTLKEAIDRDDFDSLKLRLCQEPLVNQAGLDACLVLAMPSCSLQTIKLLLQLGAKLKPISWSAIFNRGDPVVFQLLIESGWDIDSTEQERPAVHRAIRHEELLLWLLEHGANPDARSERRVLGSCFETSAPLAEASTLSDPTSLRMLLAYGAKMDPDAIFHAIGVVRGSTQSTATMKVLIEHGADVNCLSTRWGTPIYYTVRRKEKEKLKLLLEHGADPNLKPPRNNLTALELAKERGLMDLYELMAASVRGEGS